MSWQRSFYSSTVRSPSPSSRSRRSSNRRSKDQLERTISRTRTTTTTSRSNSASTARDADMSARRLEMDELNAQLKEMERNFNELSTEDGAANSAEKEKILSEMKVLMERLNHKLTKIWKRKMQRLEATLAISPGGDDDGDVSMADDDDEEGSLSITVTNTDAATTDGEEATAEEFEVIDDGERGKVDDDLIRGRIRAAFGELSRAESVLDVERYKSLLELLVKSTILCAKLTVGQTKEDFMEELLDVALDKLPDSKRAQVVARFRGKAAGRNGSKMVSLRNLRKYLQDELILYARLLNSGQVSVSKSSGRGRGRFAEPSEPPAPSCRYCHMAGHSLVRCPEKNSVLCVRCIRFGHTRNFCNRAIKLATDIEM